MIEFNCETKCAQLNDKQKLRHCCCVASNKFILLRNAGRDVNDHIKKGKLTAVLSTRRLRH